MRNPLALAVVVCTLAVGPARPAAARAQDASAPARIAPASYASGYTAVSPTTSASWYLRADSARVGSLALLVLWRGAPGWAAGGGSAGVDGPAESGGPVREWRRHGGVHLEWETDPARRVVRVAGREVALGDDNVLLVDSVDGAAGPMRVVGTARIAPVAGLARGAVHGAVFRAVQADSALARFVR